MCFCFALGLNAISVYGQDASPYSKGVNLYGSKRFAEALAQFESPQIDSTQAANAAYYRALCYHQLGKLKEASAAYKLVFAKFPQSPAGKNALKTLITLDPKAATEAVKASDIPRPAKIDWTELPDQVVVPFRKGGGGGGHIYVNGSINGVPITMLFDTGASSTTCTESFLTSRNIQVKKTKYKGRAMGVGGEVDTYLAMAEVSLGQMKRQIPLMVEDDRAMKANGGKEPLSEYPLLGQSFFYDLPYMIDDGRQQIIFSKPTGEPLPSRGSQVGGRTASKVKLADNEVPFIREGSHIVITVKINGRETEMYFDTGAGSVAFADRHLAQYGINRPTSALEGRGGGVGGQREAFSFVLDSVKVGNVERRNVRATVLINANFDKPLLGQTFLSGLRYTIDPTRNCIRFD